MITRPIRKQRNFLILIACLLAALVLVAVSFRNREPHYKGHSLSYWVTLYGDTAWDEGGDPKAREAISHIGTNALPFLLNWIRYEQQPSRVRTAAISFFSRRVPKAITPESLVRWVCEDKEKSKADGAVHAFYALGSQIRPALPELFRLMNDRSSTNASPRFQLAPCERAELALLYSRNDDALPLFLAHIANTNAPNRASVAFLIGQYRLTTNAGPALAALVQCLMDNDREVRESAAEALSRGCLYPNTVVPALTNYLAESTNYILRRRIIWVLGDIATQSRPAQPFLVAALQDPDASVRKQATNALLEIAPEILTNTPTQ